MNKKAQSILMGVVVGLFLFMAGMIFVDFIDLETESMLTSLNCGNSTNPNLTVSDGVKATCLVGEIVTPYYIVIIFATAGGIIMARFL